LKVNTQDPYKSAQEWVVSLVLDLSRPRELDQDLMGVEAKHRCKEMKARVWVAKCLMKCPGNCSNGMMKLD